MKSPTEIQGAGSAARNRPLNKGALAVALNRSPGYVSAMVRAGYVPRYGTRTTLDHALAWLESNPHFRYGQAYPRQLSAAGTR